MLGHALAGAGDAALKALAADYEAFATNEADVRDIDDPIAEKHIKCCIHVASYILLSPPVGGFLKLIWRYLINRSGASMFETNGD